MSAAASRRRYGAHVRANGIRVHYLRFGGSGPPVIIVPGITSPAETWDFVGERLAQRYDVHVMDVRGRGLSEAGPALEYSTEACARDVHDLAQALGLRDYLLVGHSMGARIGARVASRHGRGLGRLVLADPPVSGPGRRPYPKPLPGYLEAIERAARGDVTLEEVRAAYPRWTEAQWRKRIEWLHTCDPRAVRDAHQAFHEEDFLVDVRAIGVPTLLVVAGVGDVIRDADVSELSAALPGLTVTHMPESSHMLPFDDLESFASAIEAFCR